MKKNNKHKVEIGLGLAAAATAGAIFLFGTKKGKAERKKIKGWALKAKAEVIQKMEKMAEIDKKKFEKTVDTVLKKYKTMKDVATPEVAALGRELKRHWNHIAREIEKSPKSKSNKRRRTSAKKK